MLLHKVTIENYRGFGKIEVDLCRSTTVLIGENNTGKTSFLDALRLCLGRSFSRRGNPFEDYDYHLASKGAQPGEGGKLSITLDFAEERADEWSDELVQSLADVMVFHEGDLRHITLRVTSEFDKTVGDFVTDWEFLDSDGNGLGPKTKRPQILYALQQLNPVFYLSAQRDAAREFDTRSSFWAPFLRNPSIPIEVRKELEDELSDLNAKILGANTHLQEVKEKLAKAQELVALGTQDIVSIEALPGSVWTMLSRAQVNVAGATGASLPLIRHGAGTQSLAVIFLFDAFLNSMLGQAYDKLSEPILALEEPEAHLHPSAIRSLWATLDSMKGQKIIATHSGDLLSEVPLSAIRRFRRRGEKIEVCRVQDNTLDDNDSRKLKFHLRMTRGELLFARCWLLGEGPTEYWIFSETARILGVDLERLGIRIITFAQVGVLPFAKIADDLGIGWYCVVDGDSSGQNYRKSLLTKLNGRPASEHITVLPAPNMEQFLCENGFGDIYLRHVLGQKKRQLTACSGDPNYWEQVVKCLDRVPKESLALEVMEQMKTTGTEAVPSVLRQIIEGAKTLTEA